MSVTSWYDQIVITNGYDPFEDDVDPDRAYDAMREEQAHDNG